MRTTIAVLTQPVTEVVSLDLLKQHCRIDHASDDALLTRYLRSARVMVETYTNRSLLTQTLTLTMQPEDPRWPDRSHYFNRPIFLPRGPVQSISSVTVRDELGNTTTLSAATLPISTASDLLGYKADLLTIPARLVIGPATLLVDGRQIRVANLDNIQIQYVAGYTTADVVPPQIVDAVLMMALYLYENRGDVQSEPPMNIAWLLDSVRVPAFG